MYKNFFNKKANLIGYRILIFTLVMSFILLTFCSCSKSSIDGVTTNALDEYSSESKSSVSDKESSVVSYANTEDASQESKLLYSGNRKIVRNAEISLSTEKYNDTIKAIYNSLEKYQGYIEESDEDNNGYNNTRYMTLIVRVPAEKLDIFLTSMDGIATINSKSVSSDDITNSYVDTESRLKALETEQETLLGLLEKAESLSDVLSIQDRLTSVRSNIKYYQSIMNEYNDELEYSKVSIYINEVSREVEQGEGFFAQIFAGLKNNLYSIGHGAKNFLIWLITSIPYILIFVAVFFIIKKIVKKIKRKKDNKGKDNGKNGE